MEKFKLNKSITKLSGTVGHKACLTASCRLFIANSKTSSSSWTWVLV